MQRTPLESHQHRGVKLAYWDVASWHLRLAPLERDERPVIAIDFAVRRARAEDGGADDDLGDTSGHCRLEIDHGGGRESESENARHSSASNCLA